MSVNKQEVFLKKGHLFFADIWNDSGVSVGFTSKTGGVSCRQYASFNQSYTVGDDIHAVRSNRYHLAAMLDTNYEKWVFPQQLHTNNIEKVTHTDCGAGSESFDSGVLATDGLYTSDPNIVLTTFHADCTPVYFFDKQTKMIGIVHAGWQGTIKEITSLFLKKWVSIGSKMENVEIIIGPSAQQANYEIGSDVEKLVKELSVPKAAETIQYKDGAMYLDVPLLNFLQAIENGVPHENIFVSRRCTITDEENFFSFRREGETGRMLAFIKKEK